jgi:hypothetical protein
MSRIIIPRTKLNKESLTTKLTLIIVGLTAGSALLVPATYASFHPVTSGEIADETIRSVDIRNGEVTTGDIGTGAVRSGDILDDQVYSVDIRNSQVASVDIANGQVASVDIQDNGITSADLGNVVTIVKGSAFGISPGASNSGQADCPSGKILTGGGFFVTGFGSHLVHVTQSYPQDSNTWSVGGFNSGTQPSDLTPYALCV